MEKNKNSKIQKVFKYIPILVLCCFSLLGIGFSTWAYFTPGVKQTSINVIASDVLSVDMFSIGNISTFILGPDGIVEDETIVSTGKITISFKINNDIASNGYISSENIFTFNAKLRSNQSAFLTNCVTATPTVDLSGTIIADNSTPETLVFTNKVTCTITDTTANSKTNINITYVIGNEIATFYNNLPVLSFELEAIAI